MLGKGDVAFQFPPHPGQLRGVESQNKHTPRKHLFERKRPCWHSPAFALLGGGAKDRLNPCLGGMAFQPPPLFVVVAYENVPPSRSLEGN